MALVFVETSVFTKRVVDLRLEDELRELQNELLRNPMAGDIDAGTGSLRKIRMRAGRRNKGKRGGARVHYLYLANHDVVYLIFVYGKNEQESLTRDQKKQLKAISELIKEEWTERQ